MRSEPDSRIFVAVFERADQLLAAAESAPAAGLEAYEAFTPHPVHGLERALGLRASRLPLVAFLCGLGGVGFMLWFQLWTSTVDWRLNVGGRPWNSSLAFLAVTFEVLVLSAGLGTVLAFLVRSRLYPGRTPRPPVERVTDDRYALLLRDAAMPLELDEVARALAPFAPLAVEQRWAGAGQ